MGGHRSAARARFSRWSVETPVRFELVFNRKTAKALGLTFPAAILQKADRVTQ
ncbi:MAG: hypothetical protein ABIS45_08095 [Burkholderiales bacterium]